MKSYKCSQCSLTNWTTVEFCKRCQNPNPHFVYDPNSNTAENFSYQANSSNQFHRSSNFNDQQSPPPPNFYGGNAGSASQTYPNENFRADNFQSRPFQRNYPSEILEKLKKSEKDINNAWKAGRAWSLFIGAFMLLGVFFVFFFAGKAADVFGFVFVFILLAIAGGMFGLSYGIKQKSRACVVILLTLTSLGLLGNLLTILTTGKIQNALGFIFSILLTYYFALGTQGMFNYYQIKRQYPELIN